MGSMHNCCLTGFLCRLCSGIHKKVIHIYGREGQILLLSQKINEYLPVTVSPADQLPKTICFDCKVKVDQHHELIKMIKRNYEKFKSRQLPDEISITDSSEPSSVSSLPSVPDNEKEEEGVTNPLTNDITIPTGGSSTSS